MEGSGASSAVPGSAGIVPASIGPTSRGVATMISSCRSFWFAEHGKIAQQRHFFLADRAVGIIQPGNDEALPAGKLDRCFGRAAADAGDSIALQLDAVGIVQLTDFGRDLQDDATVAEDEWRDAQPDAEFLIFDRDRAAVAAATRLGHGDRNLATGKEMRLLARPHDQRGLGEHLRQAGARQGAEHGTDAAVRSGEEQVERVLQRRGSRKGEAGWVESEVGEAARRDHRALDIAAELREIETECF
jgi:hypothetical protein